MEHILELEKVCKRFPGSGFVLEDISFSVPYGAIVGFVGENGAGKTTTIGCITGTAFKDSGKIRLFGREMGDRDTDIREKFAVVCDGDNFPPYWTAEQLSKVMEGLYKSWDPRLFQEYRRVFCLPDGRKIGQYSKGMAMKLAMAAALSHHPQLLILDEATSGLDPVMRDEMLDMFLGFVQEEDHSILLSSHITEDLEKVADYIVFIHGGRLLMTASKNDLAYSYGVMRCRESQFAAVDPKDILACRKRELQIDILVADRKAAQKKYRDIVIDHVSVDEIILLLVKGERVCAGS